VPTTLTDRISAVASLAPMTAVAHGFTDLAVLASASEVVLTSAPTTDLLGSSALFNAISGTAVITSLGTGANQLKFARFTGAATLSHNAASLILPAASDIVAEAGDAMIVISGAASNARVVAYTRADGTALTGLSGENAPRLGGTLVGQGHDVAGIGVLTMVEQAAADADVAGRGQWWVRTATPNVPMFTDDAGTDQQIATLSRENQPLTGGATITSKDLGTQTSGTLILDMGDRPLQHYINGGAHTLAPGSVAGACMVDITNDASAGAITVSGWTRTVGDVFDTGNSNAFRCHCSVGSAGSLLVVQALQ